MATAHDETYLPFGAVAPPACSDQVRVGSFQERSLVAGPGDRAVLWVAGCLRRCPRCIKPELFDFAAGRFIEIDRLVDRILGVHALKRLDGVTFSGGEPFEQAEPLGRLARLL